MQIVHIESEFQGISLCGGRRAGQGLIPETESRQSNDSIFICGDCLELRNIGDIFTQLGVELQTMGSQEE